MNKNFDFEQFSVAIADLLQLTDTKIEYECNVYDDLGIDSLSWVKVGIKLQEVYKVEIPTAEFIELETVGEVFEYIKEQM